MNRPRTGRHIDNPRAVGARLVRARGRAGLSQRGLARTVECSPTYLSRIEAGARIPSLQLLEALAPPLATTAAWLARGDAGARALTVALDSDLLDAAIRKANGIGLKDLHASERDTLARELAKQAVPLAGSIVTLLLNSRAARG